MKFKINQWEPTNPGGFNACCDHLGYEGCNRKPVMFVAADGVEFVVVRKAADSTWWLVPHLLSTSLAHPELHTGPYDSPEPALMAARLTMTLKDPLVG